MKQCDVTKSFRDYRHFKEIDFQKDLMETEWNRNSTYINILADQLVNSILDTLNKHAPMKETNIKSNWANKKWWSTEMDVELKKRDQLYRKAVITKNNDDFKEYKLQRNKVINMLRERKKILQHKNRYE